MLNNIELQDFPEDDSDEFFDDYTDSLAQADIDKKARTLPEVRITAKRAVREKEILYNRSTSVAYYDVPSELDDIYDKGEFIGTRINELMKSLNKNFFSFEAGKIMKDGEMSEGFRMGGKIHYKYLNKIPLFVVNYEPIYESDYFDYNKFSVNEIKSIYVNENESVINKYIKYNPRAEAGKFSCVVFIETHPPGMIPVEAGKGIRKTRLEGYSRVKEFYSPDYSLIPIVPNDYRRTLYWNPIVATDENGQAKIQFYNNSNCRNFSISAETVTQNGMIGVY
jgi:hypothetical protein